MGEGACTGAATRPQPSTLRLILNAAAWVAASPTLLFPTPLGGHQMSLELGGLHIPDGLVVPSCTSHPGVLGLVPKREEPGKTGARSLSRSPSLPRPLSHNLPFPRVH